jgi:RimJ/RimL family protein N-acetyltransferase
MILKGEKVILRPIKLSDAPRFVKWFNDPQVNKFMFLRKISLKEEKKWIKNSLKDKTKINLAIETKEGLHIGTTGLELNQQNCRAYFGIIIGEKEYWSRGYGTDAARTILNFGFKKLKLHRVDLDVYDYNPRAQKLYKKLGFKKEGVKREHNFYNGKFRNVVYMGLLAGEWKKK